MSSLITELALKQVPGTFTAALTNLASVVSTLSNLQQTNPAAFKQYESEITSLLKGFDSSGNIGNTLGNLTDSARGLSSTSLSPSNISDMAASMSDIASRIDNTNAVYQGGQQIVAKKTSVQASVQQNKPSGSIYIWPKDLGKYWFALGFSKYEFHSKLFGGVGYNPLHSAPSSSIILPMPQGLTDQFQVAFEDTKITMEGLSGVQGVGNALAGLSGIRGGGLAGAFATNQMASGLSQLISSGSTIALAYFGKAINPASTLLLQGPLLKEHTFSWKLSPNSEQESKDLYDIIRHIKYNMSPEAIAAGFLLDYPAVVNCYLYNESKMFAFKPAMITGFGINYSPSGMPSFYTSSDNKGGYATEIEMKIQIKELEAWLKDDFTGL